MIECNKCNGRNISVVSVVNSNKSENILLLINTIQTVAVFIEVIVLCIMIDLIRENVEIFLLIITNTYQITDALKDAVQVSGNAIIIKMTTGIFSGLFSIILGCGLFKLLLPYRIYSYQKCICHDCEFQWEYEPPAGITDIGSEHLKK